MITVQIHEEVELDSNFATKEVKSGFTGNLVIHMSYRGANYVDKVEQGGPVEDLIMSIQRGVSQIEAMLHGAEK